MPKQIRSDITPQAELVKVTLLKPNPKNPRTISRQDFERLKKQIIKLGQYKPIIVDRRTNLIAGGHMRYQALKDLNVDKVWVSYITTNDDVEALEYSLSDNDRAGAYADEQLAELVVLHPIDLDLYKVDLGQLTTLPDLMARFGPDLVDNEAPPVANVAVSQLGEIYQLGRHRLSCGDSTDIEQVNRLMAGKQADMVFTDPPYGVDYEGKTKDKLTIQNDDDTEIFARAISNFITKPGAAYYVCCPAGSNFKDFLLTFESKCRQSATIIWAKNSMVLGHGDYHYQHEPILYGWDKRGPHKFYGSRDQTTIWNIDRPSQSREHPTMKPLALIGKAIKNSSRPSEIILDLFGGSGSTLIAAEQLERTCYMTELDPKYCDVIRKRWHTLVSGSEGGWQEATPVIHSSQ